MGNPFNSGKKQAKKIAAATLKAAEMQAANDRLNAQSAVQAQETMLAQDQAATQAAELLSRPQEQVEVQLGADTEAPEIDPATGRRKSVRSTFMSKRPSSGISI